MRLVVALSLLAGCGRLGFDASDGGVLDGTRDGSLDGPTIAATAVPITGFDLVSVGTRAVDIAAVAIDDGYALSFIMDPFSSMYGVHLDTDLAPNAAVPFQTSPIAGFTTDYRTASLAWDGANLVGALALTDGSMYMKTFPRDMMLFSWSVQRPGQIGEPSVARAGTQAISTWFSGSTLHFTNLMANGETDGTYRVADAMPANIVTTSAASGEVMLVAAALTTGSCFLHAITSTSTTMGAALAGPCASPYAVGSGTSFVVAYETSASSFAVRSVTAAAGAAPVSGPELLSHAGRSPRLFDAGGERMVAFIEVDGLGIVRLSDSAPAIVSGLPSGAPDAIEVAGAYVFASYGATVVAVTLD